MPDMCLCRWVAFGTIPEVQRFVRAARSKRPKTVRGRRRASAEPLSFQQLWPLGPDDDPSDRYETPSTEPDDCSTTGVKRTGTTAARVSYSFLTIWGEPYGLVRHVSKQFPRLDFVLGAVAPAVGEANSWYFRAGRGKNWVMGGRRHEQIYRQTYAAAGVDPEDDYIDPGLEYGLDIRFRPCADGRSRRPLDRGQAGRGSTEASIAPGRVRRRSPPRRSFSAPVPVAMFASCASARTMRPSSIP